jgi:Golgi nucleoside diphosphatase
MMQVIFRTVISFCCIFIEIFASNSVDYLDIFPNITNGFVIDAGSGGSRMHVFEWEPRIFHTLPPPISYPTTNEYWTGRMSPGIATLNTKEDVESHLAPLIDFAKSTLTGKEDQFHLMPLFFKATGGMRELPLVQRERIMLYVREVLSNKKFCPFFFQYDLARVISGEEEAVFSWAAVNFVLGTFLKGTKGTGEALPTYPT